MATALVSLYYVPSDGEAWALYIGQILRADEYTIDCQLCDFTAGANIDMKSSKVNVFFVTPDFLEHSDWQRLHAVDKSSCILVLTGIEQADLEAVMSTRCKQIDDYYIYEMMESEKSVRDLLIFIISKYEEEEGVASVSDKGGHRQISLSLSLPKDYKYAEGEDPEDDYDPLPAPRQVNKLHEILFKDDKLYVLLTRRPEGNITIQIENEEYSPDLEEYAVYELEFKGEEKTEVKVLQDGSLLGQMVVELEPGEPGTPTSGSKPRFKSFTIPESQAVSVQTEVDDLHQTEPPPPAPHFRAPTEDDLYINTHGGQEAKREKSKLDQLRELLEDETDPEQILCECLGIENSSSCLDNKMTSMVEEVGTLRPPSSASELDSSDEPMCPTLLHFGAEYNLRKFCDALLGNPLLRGACLIPNRDGNLPHDIARLKGHHELADMLKTFSEQERDSGISGSDLRTSMSVGPPSPHATGWDDYVPMGQTGHHRTLSSSTDKTVTPPAAEMARMQEALRDDLGAAELGREKPHHKDLKQLLGMQEEDTLSLDGGGKKKQGKLKRLFGKRERSPSDPLLNVEGFTILRSKSTKSYFRNSRSSRSSGSSISSALSDEMSEVQLRDRKLNNFGKRLTKKFLDSAKKRKSARIERALGDITIGPPALPSRLAYDPNEKF